MSNAYPGGHRRVEKGAHRERHEAKTLCEVKGKAVCHYTGNIRKVVISVEPADLTCLSTRAACRSSSSGFDTQLMEEIEVL